MPALSVRAPKSLRRCGKDQACHFFGFIHLHKVAGGWQKEQIRGGKQFVKAFGNAFIKVRIGSAENDSHRWPKRSHLRNRI